MSSIVPNDDARCPGLWLNSLMIKSRSSAQTSGSDSIGSDFKSAGLSILFKYLYSIYCTIQPANIRQKNGIDKFFYRISLNTRIYKEKDIKFVSSHVSANVHSGELTESRRRPKLLHFFS